MQVPCPNCMRMVEQERMPTRSDKGSGDIWMCIRCPQMVCGHPVTIGPDTSIPCYTKHTQEAHPEVYGLKSQPTAGSKKNKKGKKR